MFWDVFNIFSSRFDRILGEQHSWLKRVTNPLYGAQIKTCGFLNELNREK
jgi:hypothetical protein